MMLITGGARSGKSRFAEQVAEKRGGEVLYIATSVVTDAEMAERIRYHQQQRPAHWHTFESYRDLGNIILEHQVQFPTIIIECITTLMTNLLFDIAGETSVEDMDFEAIEQHIFAQTTQLTKVAQQADSEVIIVTNEVGMGIVPDNLLARRFRDIAGRVNQQLAAAADDVYLIVSGIPVPVKTSE
ncbi:bifunctional adenosylcobinamide kinase/adenosylcobinamide-phosphate guanylyltransferase [Rahnella sp. C60]|uniref:Bifunctional adenosylcobalamin biosynthesis protein n=1 Tax=Rahnella perminowiae TaxID=2816244 RepID=A0ABS6L0Q2_9GAMM|nr:MULTISPECIES: bifunctional adenosylcobinamide kinase/adenosylcobinamide-phosphate guanylyltransferase [Rahnella]MBU9809160.1 bifunctional adenosylcobinamide kinase/adenosylcobinamide-phosphate guanylyltransferase [Rahnella perminowiae]MBU9817912.1 bifunctional adenosylcobinamide kinase/adenosylcobinamide-phosphate guanylyltransferase [Rahnella perminowiae]MBU9827675.1 bifunctional adenosylcobinamide kinase/adenosylcobinamide-phosphate guanylyltransferase [Rahnella perminowiae]MBU9835415.1 bi